MSRRSRHGRRPHTATTSPDAPADVEERPRPATATTSAVDEPVAEPRAIPSAVVSETPVERLAADAAQRPEAASAGERVEQPPMSDPEGAPLADGEAPRTTCTQAQLRRFIKSRPWIPMHELRRRFGIFGGDDDVTPVRVASGTIFVGLPAPEARMLGELLSGGDVGYELSLDPGAPIVVGVYPMRPVPRG